MITPKNELTITENLMEGYTAVLGFNGKQVTASYYRTQGDECIIVLDKNACVKYKFYDTQVNDIWKAFFQAFREYDLIEIAD